MNDAIANKISQSGSRLGLTSAKELTKLQTRLLKRESGLTQPKHVGNPPSRHSPRGRVKCEAAYQDHPDDELDPDRPLDQREHLCVVGSVDLDIARCRIRIGGHGGEQRRREGHYP
jgi:hypothetical protein